MNCALCRYWLNSAAHGQVCRRFPKKVLVGADDWCGEFKDIAEIPVQTAQAQPFKAVHASTKGRR